MLDTIHPVRFLKPMGAGRTKPSLIECEKADGSIVEVVVKCSSGTIQGCHDLGVEAVTGMVAADLGLPIPEFFAVELDSAFIDLVDDQEAQQALRTSDVFAFGSKALPGGFNVWGKDQPIPDSLCIAAAEVFTFDAIVINGDRRPDNPNCLFSGTDFAIIDHELCFAHELFWIEPWLEGGFRTRSASAEHIFAKPRMIRCPDALPRFEEAWDVIEPNRVDEYFHALPRSWAFPSDKQERIKNLLLNAKANIAQVVQQSLGALR
ncbi:HipA family kinase [Bordetella genomosp. 1]|uniref:HipA family kinase n=1 Tax=Bordetella genomosp. 1 TaxID=1395607 RepID=UPI0011409C7D|nr:HipA family kinase [Bordetella genomosp. 1]